MGRTLPGVIVLIVVSASWSQQCVRAFCLQVGAVVEVKNQDGVYQEATINKLTDASIYTVGKSISRRYYIVNTKLSAFHGSVVLPF